MRKSLKRIFQGAIRYTIPLYQRPCRPNYEGTGSR
jgi:hypothetical protein